MGSKRTRVQAPKPRQDYTPVYMKDGNYYKRTATPVQPGNKGSPGKPRPALGNNKNKAKVAMPNYERIQGPGGPVMGGGSMQAQPYTPQIQYNPMGMLKDPYGGGGPRVPDQRQYDPNVASMPMPVNRHGQGSREKPTPGGGLMKYGANRGQIGMAPNLFR